MSTPDPRYAGEGLYAGVPMWAGLEDDDDTPEAGSYEALALLALHPQGKAELRPVVTRQAWTALCQRAAERSVEAPPLADFLLAVPLTS